MQVIHKQTLRVADKQYVTLPLGATVLSVQMQREMMCVWYLYDRAEARTEERTFYVVGTGNPIAEPVHLRETNFVGTVQAGPFVWHVFVSFGRTYGAV